MSMEENRSEMSRNSSVRDSGSKANSVSVENQLQPGFKSPKASELESNTKSSVESVQPVASQLLLPLLNSLIDSRLTKLRDLVTASVTFGLFLSKTSSQTFPFQSTDERLRLAYPMEGDSFQKSMQIHQDNWLVIMQALKDAQLDGFEILPAGWTKSFTQGDEEVIAEFLVLWLAFLEKRFPESLDGLKQSHAQHLEYVLSGQIAEHFACEAGPNSHKTPSKLDIMSKILRASTSRKHEVSEPKHQTLTTPDKQVREGNYQQVESDLSRRSVQELLAAVHEFQTANRVLKDDLIHREKEVLSLKQQLESSNDEVKFQQELIAQKENEILCQSTKIDNLEKTLHLLNGKAGKSVWQAQLEAAEEKNDAVMAELDVQIKQHRELERKYFQLVNSKEGRNQPGDVWTSNDMEAQKTLESKVRITELENLHLKDKLEAKEQAISTLTEQILKEKSNNDRFVKQFSEIHAVATQRELALSSTNQTCASLRAEIEQLKDQLHQKGISMKRLELELNQIVQNGHSKNTEVLQMMRNLHSEPQANINLVHLCKEVSRIHLMETQLLHNVLHDLVVTELTVTPLQELVESKLRQAQTRRAH